MKSLTPALLIGALRRLGHTVFEGQLNMNVIGIRAKDHEANTFNDVMCLLYQHGGHWQLKAYAATTDPGTYYRENPENVKGTAIVAPGQYPICWQLGRHQGKYDALVQRGKITVYRDADMNSQIDLDPNDMETGFFGINCHRANKTSKSTSVGKWSAGCQVLACANDFNQFMNLCRDSATRYGPHFTYTLIDERDL